MPGEEWLVARDPVASLDRLTWFETVHGVAISEQHRQWVRNHRLRVFTPLIDDLARIVGPRRAEAVRYRLLAPAEVASNRAIVSIWRAALRPMLPSRPNRPPSQGALDVNCRT